MRNAEPRMARSTAARYRARIQSPTIGNYTEHMAEQLSARPFQSKGERTRHRLKVGGLRVLETVGYAELRITDVCREADLSLGAFYVYFADKKDLATAVLLEFGEDLYARGLKAASGKDAYDAILQTNRFFVSAYDANRGLVRCLVQLDDVVPEFQSRWREIRYRWTRRIAASIAKRSGTVSISEATRCQIAFALEGMVFHFLYDLFVREEPYLVGLTTDLEAVAELLSLLWYRAVYCANPHSSLTVHELLSLRAHARHDS
jgi:TetR/AcrR family transcriptional regulator, transcriptional repressor for nem operon